LSAAAGFTLAIVLGTRALVPPAQPQSAPLLYGARVEAEPATLYWMERTPVDEQIVLIEGALRIDAELGPGRQVRIWVAGAQLTAREAYFEVEASATRLGRIHVLAGEVELTLRDAQPLLLGASSTWPSAAEAPPEAPAVVDPPAARLRRRPIVKVQALPLVAPSAPPVVIGSGDYERGWAALRAQDYRAAADHFAAAATSAPDLERRAEAGYFLGISQARAGEEALAASTLRALLDSSPGSQRAGEAAAILGWIEVERGEPAEAESHFRLAIERGPESAAMSGAQGLEALEVEP